MKIIRLFPSPDHKKNAIQFEKPISLGAGSHFFFENVSLSKEEILFNENKKSVNESPISMRAITRCAHVIIYVKYIMVIEKKKLHFVT